MGSHLHKHLKQLIVSDKHLFIKNLTFSYFQSKGVTW